MIGTNPEEQHATDQSALSKAMAKIIKFALKRLPGDFGVVVLAYPMDQDSAEACYASNVPRKVALRLMIAFVAANK